MPIFEDLFRESKGQPIEYQGKRLVLADWLPVSKGDGVIVTFIRATGRFRQGVALATKGTFTVDGQTIKKAVVLWMDTAPPTVNLTVMATDGSIVVKNVWDHGDGVIQSWHNGAAMIVDQIAPDIRRYSCNDGEPDDDLDDVVFTIRQERARP